ncbi:hypothetical protein [Chitinophaga sp. sic0106]|uniref:hypothetical protein n=1 Tax=Chitinophaga sp. sic0106 TaxID=2854785 RepID=UPI001C4957F6|nr:hypothetical protein [Chitinophaga sp. sic0106]MBV7529067.1 hypothetical protein [Chitinophaga sp. sic0106]
MKKWLYPLLMVVVVLFTASGCTKTYNDIIPSTTILADVAANQWKTDDGGKTYYFLVTTPELTQSTAESDGVVVAMDRGNGVFEALPEVYQNTSFTFLYEPGTVSIEASGVNGAPVTLPTGTITIKITIIPANPTN